MPEMITPQQYALKHNNDVRRSWETVQATDKQHKVGERIPAREEAIEKIDAPPPLVADRLRRLGHK